MEDLRLNGLLVSYRDDQIDESVRSSLKGKSRVRYRCMDTFAHFLAFGTSSGAVYLYRLNAVTHCTCSLMSMIPCDQGSIEVIKLLASPQSEDLLIACGTSRGSVVILRLFQGARDQQQAYCDEIYKAESFTNNSSIKLIESDQDLLDPAAIPQSFSRLYICDSADRLYVLESNIIFAGSNKNGGLRLFRQSHQNSPSLIFSANDSCINQVSVHRSHLLISTDETTRLYSEQSNQLKVIGKKKRKAGFYGACFFNPNYKPNKLQLQQQPQSQHTSYSSLVSVNGLESLLIFVARPMFRMWQVNYQCDVMFTHQFEQSLRTTSSRFSRLIVELENVPLADNTIDDPTDVMRCFEADDDMGDEDPTTTGSVTRTEQALKAKLRSDHFHKLVPIYSSTLGNLLLSYSQHELFIIDPIGAELVTWCSLKEATIIQVSCNENEVFIWCQVIEQEQKQFLLRRLVLLAPTQFVLELHRCHRYLTLVMFVQQFVDLFRDRMALPLCGPNIITTEGGLLRNILLNAWDVVNQWRNNTESQQEWLSGDLNSYCVEFKQLVEEIVDESKQLKSSLDNLTDSRFFLAMANENIDRLLSEPYASLVSLEVSIAELHTSHVIHFSRDAINRHKSVANLTQNLRAAVHEAKSRTRSQMDLSSNDCNANNMPSKSMRDLTQKSYRAKKAQVIVERQRPTKRSSSVRFGGSRFEGVAEGGGTEELEQQQQQQPQQKQMLLLEEPEPTFFSAKAAQETKLNSISECGGSEGTATNGLDGDSSSLDEQEPEQQEPDEAEDERKLQRLRCQDCQWPKAKSHLEALNNSQLIQLKWIEENLTTNFFENIDLIEERAFKYSLWHLFLKCLAFKRQIDNYVTCCMVLDDVRLLDIEQLVIICSGEDEMMNLLLTHLNRKMELQEKHKSCARPICLKCEKEFLATDGELETDKPDTTKEVDEQETDRQHQPEVEVEQREEDHAFNLANIFNQFIKRNNSNIKRMVGHFLNYTKLLNNSRIPIGLYLKAIESTANRSKRTKIWYAPTSATLKT